MSLTRQTVGKKGAILLNSIVKGRSGTIRRISDTYAEQRANYRFLNNPRVKETSLISDSVSRTKIMCKGRHVLSIQDTTEFNFGNTPKRTKPNNGLGPLRISKTFGFFLHPCLVLDAFSLAPLGFSHIDIWNRDADNGNRYSRNYPSLPIEDKESFKWIRSSKATKATLDQAASVTIIQDREGDIYEQFAGIPDSRTHLLIRASSNRRLSTGANKVFDHLSEQKVQASYLLSVEDRPRQNRKAREAQMEIKYKQVEIQRPGKCPKTLPKTLKLYIVEAKESLSTVPEGETPICWRIWTSHEVDNTEQAITIIEWYSARWLIEQVFRLMKKKGFAIEDSELETGWAIRKLAILVLQGVLKICQMMIAYGKEDSQHVTEVFEDQEIECLEKLNRKLEGNTSKTKNPYPKNRLSYATWIIARLGGWNGYKSERPPGPITLKNGMDQFNSIMKGWLMINGDVYTR